jgi:hypothetical protein
MATGISCPQIYYVTPTEVNGIAVDMRGLLRQGEVLTGTPTITGSGLTLSGEAVSSGPLVINGEAVEAAKAVVFTVTGGTDGTDYSIKVACGTSSSRTRNTHVILKVRVPTVTNP